MNTSDGGKAGRSSSVSHTRGPSFDGTPCRLTGAGEAMEASATGVVIQVSSPTTQQTQPRDGTSSHAYAFEQETKIRLPQRKRRNESKQLSSRQRSHYDQQQLLSPGQAASSATTMDEIGNPGNLRRVDSRMFDVVDDMDVEHQLYQLLDQTADAQDVDLVDPYMKASMQPPITHESLSELDVARIIQNPKLRHDVNFDRELHFRPNLDGSRGRHKLRAADEYWRALIGELELYRACGAQLLTCHKAHDLAHWARMMKASQKRLPGVFDTIRDVLKTLVPDRDRVTIDERLDVEMIMQEISKGVFDLMGLAQWLARLLKAHCAPMRDEWIDQMVMQTQRGVDEGCQRRIVLGLRQLLGILEAMKLVSELE